MLSFVRNHLIEKITFQWIRSLLPRLGEEGNGLIFQSQARLNGSDIIKTGFGDLALFFGNLSQKAFFPSASNSWNWQASAPSFPFSLFIEGIDAPKCSPRGFQHAERFDAHLIRTVSWPLHRATLLILQGDGGAEYIQYLVLFPGHGVLLNLSKPFCVYGIPES